jgi:acyl-coenzyme A synthetase/AMP-(fatty) acid ligase
LKVPVYATGKGDRDLIKDAVDLDKAILTTSPKTPTQQDNTHFSDDLFFLYTSGTTG